MEVYRNSYIKFIFSVIYIYIYIVAWSCCPCIHRFAALSTFFQLGFYIIQLAAKVTKLPFCKRTSFKSFNSIVASLSMLGFLHQYPPQNFLTLIPPSLLLQIPCHPAHPTCSNGLVVAPSGKRAKDSFPFIAAALPLM